MERIERKIRDRGKYVEKTRKNHNATLDRYLQ